MRLEKSLARINWIERDADDWNWSESRVGRLDTDWLSASGHCTHTHTVTETPHSTIHKRLAKNVRILSILTPFCMLPLHLQYTANKGAMMRRIPYWNSGSSFGWAFTVDFTNNFKLVVRVDNFRRIKSYSKLFPGNVAHSCKELEVCIAEEGKLRGHRVRHTGNQMRYFIYIHI